MEKTVCELFAGVGGFRLGLEKTGADWKTTWFSQWEPNKTKQWAHDCYVSHFGEINEFTGVDISKVDKRAVPDHNLLVGGFPCQNYSVAASKSSKGIEGEKGVLWWQIRNMLIAKRAPFVLLENVDRLLKSPASQRGRDFGIMLTCMAQLGYIVEWRVINAAEYGAGQRRRRIFIFAYHNQTNYGRKMNRVGLTDIVLSKGFFTNTFPIEGMDSIGSSSVPVTDIASDAVDMLLDIGNEQANADLVAMSDSYKFDFKDAGIMRNGEVVTIKVIPKLEKPILLKDIVEHSADDKYNIPLDKLVKWEYLKGAKKINRTAKNGHEYVFSEGPVAFPDPLDRPSRTMLTSESSLNRSTHVLEDPVTGKLRLLTPVEAERLQGFDDNWTNTGMPEKFRYFCMGNALVVPMITRMGKTLNKIFEAED